MASDLGYIDDIPLEMETLEDHFEKSIVRYEYPYLDGADLDDMGQKARTVRVRCHFWDEGSHLTYDNHKVLIAYLKKKENFELLHPELGTMEGKVESVDVHYDDSENAVAVDFTFIEQMRAPDAMVAVADVDVISEGFFLDSINQQLVSLDADLYQVYIDPTVTIMPGGSLLGQMKGLAGAARAYVRQIDNAMGRLSSLANEVTQPTNSLIATISYAENLPGRFLGTIDRCVERSARLYDSLQNFPSRFAAGVKIGLQKIQSDLDSFLSPDSHGAKAMVLKHLQVACARRLALETSYLYAADSNARRTEKEASSPAAFDPFGRYTPRQTPDVVPMNANELEETLATARTTIQAAIDSARDNQALQNMALALEQTVSDAKQSAERVVTVTPDLPLPLHILCLKQGLNYSDAERVMNLNPTLRNPSFVAGPVQVYVR